MTALDVAEAMDHADCVDVLQQHAAVHRCTSDVPGQVAARARDAAEAEYALSDELELRRHAADVVATTLNNACTALLTAQHDRRHVDQQKPARASTKVISTASTCTRTGSRRGVVLVSVKFLYVEPVGWVTVFSEHTTSGS